jgi:phosphoenolpyruvate phosphomutase
MGKSKRLMDLFTSSDPGFLMEAHNGLSAKIVQEAGFQGIWASSLSISASLGVRDSNEASWTQILEILEFMSDATDIPILVDADTGYGNFNNVRRLVKKLEQREIAGMCIEEKLFPKTNSLLEGAKQPLANIDEFAGKVKAAKDTQRDENFCVVARIEAFIAGYGLSEVLKRAEAYHLAGADAILVHSKEKTPHQVISFLEEWRDTSPVILVPTAYNTTPTQTLIDAGADVIIWANHLLRSSVSAMQSTAAKIYSNQRIDNLDGEIASVAEIFRLQDMNELRRAEKRYLK